MTNPTHHLECRLACLRRPARSEGGRRNWAVNLSCMRVKTTSAREHTSSPRLPAANLLDNKVLLLYFRRLEELHALALTLREGCGLGIRLLRLRSCSWGLCRLIFGVGHGCLLDAQLGTRDDGRSYICVKTHKCSNVFEVRWGIRKATCPTLLCFK